jgi:dihydroflavonol-4-reductase
MTRAVAVTGATGFIGAHVVRQLVLRGDRVRVLVRSLQKLDNLPDLDVEPVQVDLTNSAVMRRALEGCELLFHLAGEIGGRERDRIRQINSAVPARIVEAANVAGLCRVVITSTASAVGPAPSGEDTTEDSPYRSFGFVYVDSKQAGEIAALEAGRRCGIDVVVTNPTYCLGAPLNRSLRGAPSTRLVGNYLCGRLPAVVDAYNNFVGVQDVAAGHLLAGEKGQPGERYLLGAENLTWVQFIKCLRAVSGISHPVVVLPRRVERLAERKRLLGLPNPLPREPVRLMAKDWRYSVDKARRELGYQPAPIDAALTTTVDWYRELIEGGAFANTPQHAVDRMGRLLRGADRVGLLSVLRALARIHVI